VRRLIAENFVPAAGDDWYRRRAEDEEGAFFRRLADAAGRRGEGGGTRQGLYCLTAGGRLLAFKNVAEAGEVRRLLERGLAAWRALPEEERAPRSFAEARPARDPRYERAPPPGGLVLRVRTRELERDGADGYCRAAPRGGRPALAALDHLWLTREEARALVPARGEEPVPAAIARRIARFHLVDDTRGEPVPWRREEVRLAEMTVALECAEGAVVTARVRGAARLETASGDRGFEAVLAGVIVYDREAAAFRRFDLLAVGEHWGAAPFAPGARPGRAPLGVAFALADGGAEADRVPPQGAREGEEYWR
jgi:hypothetical protein